MKSYDNFQNVQSHNSGAYSCRAKNIYGSVNSNVVEIEVKCKLTNMKMSSLNYLYIISDSPKCRHKDDMVLVVKKGQQAVLSCNMDAHPLSNIKFRWTFNASDVERFVEVSLIQWM